MSKTSAGGVLLFKLSASSTVLSVTLMDGASPRTLQASTSSLLDNKWHHVAVSVDRARITFYLEGVMLAMQAVATGLADQAGGTLQLGSAPLEPTLLGSLESVVFFSQPLAEADVAPLAKVPECLDPSDQFLGQNCFVGYRVSPYCACPLSHPRISYTDETACENLGGGLTQR